MNNITIIIPIHEYDKNIESLLQKAYDSIPNGFKTIMSCSKTAASGVKKQFNGNGNVTVMSNDVTSFVGLVGKAVDKVETKYFSILEFDDTYTDIWFKNVSEYIKFNPSVSVFMPLTDLYNFNTNKFIGYGNEAVWASSFSDEIGFLDNESLENFYDFYVTGSVFNTEDWKELGGLKESFTFAFWYEFLLRATHFEKKVMVIPKIGYRHNLDRKGSLLNQYSESSDDASTAKWIEIAKKEQIYKEDRDLKKIKS